MKNIFYLSLTLLALIHMSACIFGKKNINSTVSIDKVNVVKTENFDKNNYRKLVIYCGKDSIFYDSKLEFIRSSNIDTYYCLREKAFQGDTTACRQISIIIPLMRNPFSIFDKNLRGEILFMAVLEQVNNFEFIPNYDGEIGFYTYYGRYVRVLFNMIETIDGVSEDTYLQEYYPERFKAELMGIELFSPEYIQKSGKIKWEIIKEAYDKGLIKLKDFGQE